MATITKADRELAADFGTTPEAEAAAREARTAHAAAWRNFEAYVIRGDHDTTSEEFARLRGELLDARTAKDAAERACWTAA